VVESQSAVLKAACQETSREGWPGVSCLMRTPGSSRETEQGCLVASVVDANASGSDVPGPALDAGSARPGATSRVVGAARCPCAAAISQSRVPVNATGTIAPTRCPERCHLWHGAACMYAQAPPVIPMSPSRSAATVQCVLREALAPLVCREPWSSPPRDVASRP